MPGLMIHYKFRQYIITLFFNKNNSSQWTFYQKKDFTDVLLSPLKAISLLSLPLPSSPTFKCLITLPRPKILSRQTNIHKTSELLKEGAGHGAYGVSQAWFPHLQNVHHNSSPVGFHSITTQAPEHPWCQNGNTWHHGLVAGNITTYLKWQPTIFFSSQPKSHYIWPLMPI